ncbi:hypothetical protein PR048_001108 [Dryococelus australis]|uniref:Uncharacterized protein n=1 Tax=Dryococelus australis TaxID=614101 RepID=A0ABQ9IGG4_9NEOP|nr:hypothetical protein PR048_001108 [Dryococelus australis]
MKEASRQKLVPVALEVEKRECDKGDLPRASNAPSPLYARLELRDLSVEVLRTDGGEARCTELRRSAMTEETGDPRENVPNSGIIRHDSHRKPNPISAYTRQEAKQKYRNRIRLERASQKQSSDAHKTPYDRVKRCRERKINIIASECVNVDQTFRTRSIAVSCMPVDTETVIPGANLLRRGQIVTHTGAETLAKNGYENCYGNGVSCEAGLITPVLSIPQSHSLTHRFILGDGALDAHGSVALMATALLGPKRGKRLQVGGNLNAPSAGPPGDPSYVGDSATAKRVFSLLSGVVEKKHELRGAGGLSCLPSPRSCSGRQSSSRLIAPVTSCPACTLRYARARSEVAVWTEAPRARLSSSSRRPHCLLDWISDRRLEQDVDFAVRRAGLETPVDSEVTVIAPIHAAAPPIQTSQYRRLKKACSVVADCASEKGLYGSLGQEELLEELRVAAEPLRQTCTPEVRQSIEVALQEAVSSWNDTCQSLLELCTRYQEAVRLWRQYRDASEAVRAWADQQLDCAATLGPEDALQHVKVSPSICLLSHTGDHR